MFLQMILKTIPRSFRAGVALVFLMILMGVGLSALKELATSKTADAWVAARAIGGLILGAVAGVFFYYYQARDEKPAEYNELETLSKYHEAEWKKSQTPLKTSYDFEKQNKTENQ